MRWKTTFAGGALLSAIMTAACFAEVGSGRSRDPDVSDPRAVGHRGVLDQPSNVGSSSRSNWHAVEAARDRGADRIVDDQTWELHRLDEDREARRETEVVLEDRDRTLRLDARKDREREERPDAQKRRGRAVGEGGPVSNRDETIAPLDGQLIDDEQAMDQARKDIGRKLAALRSSETQEIAEAQKKLSSANETEKLKAETDRIHSKYKLLHDHAMDDYVSKTDRIMGLPKMIEGPIPRDRPSTRPATKPAAKAPAVPAK